MFSVSADDGPLRKEADFTRDIVIFDITFRLTVEHPDYLIIPAAFMDAYRGAEQRQDPSGTASHIEVQVKSVDVLPPEPDDTTPVHITKHAYWTFDGACDAERRRHVWADRGIALQRDPLGERWTVLADSRADRLRISEALFHAIRGIALYRRPDGNLIHGSAVSFAGNVVGFIGESMAGKTTLMTAMLSNTDCLPFSNDRFLIHCGAELAVSSWPSYASYCEGQLAADPKLLAAARAYEEGCVYRTQRWGQDVSHLFDKRLKRTYPMIWQSELFGRKFEMRGQLDALFFCKVSSEISTLTVSSVEMKGDKALAAAARRLEACAFDQEEPSFQPWHGLSRRSFAPSMEDLLERMAAKSRQLFDLKVPIDAINDAPRRVQHVLTAHGKHPDGI